MLDISWKDKQMKRSWLELDNAAWMTYSVKKDATGLATSAYLTVDRHCTGRFQSLREIQVLENLWNHFILWLRRVEMVWTRWCITWQL